MLKKMLFILALAPLVSFGSVYYTNVGGTGMDLPLITNIVIDVANSEIDNHVPPLLTEDSINEFDNKYLIKSYSYPPDMQTVSSGVEFQNSFQVSTWQPYGADMDESSGIRYSPTMFGAYIDAPVWWECENFDIHNISGVTAVESGVINLTGYHSVNVRIPEWGDGIFTYNNVEVATIQDITDMSQTVYSDVGGNFLNKVTYDHQTVNGFVSFGGMKSGYYQLDTSLPIGTSPTDDFVVPSIMTEWVSDDQGQSIQVPSLNFLPHYNYGVNKQELATWRWYMNGKPIAWLEDVNKIALDSMNYLSLTNDNPQVVRGGVEFNSLIKVADLAAGSPGDTIGVRDPVEFYSTIKIAVLVAGSPGDTISVRDPVEFGSTIKIAGVESVSYGGAISVSDPVEFNDDIYVDRIRAMGSHINIMNDLVASGRSQFGNDVSISNGNFIIHNEGKILGTDTNGTQFSLIELSHGDMIDVGSSSRGLNLNSLGRPTVQMHGEDGNSTNELAYLADIDNAAYIRKQSTPIITNNVAVVTLWANTVTKVDMSDNAAPYMFVLTELADSAKVGDYVAVVIVGSELPTIIYPQNTKSIGVMPMIDINSTNLVTFTTVTDDITVVGINKLN